MYINRLPLPAPNFALAAAAARFPRHKSGLEEYFRRLTTLRGAVSLAARHRDDGSWWLTHALEAARALWPIPRDGRATLRHRDQYRLNLGVARGAGAGCLRRFQTRASRRRRN